MFSWAFVCVTGHSNTAAEKANDTYEHPFPGLYVATALHKQQWYMSNGDNFSVTGPLWGEFTGDREIPLIKASSAELWCFLWFGPEQTVE